MTGRREDILDAAIQVVGDTGVRGLTHRAVDAAANLPAGSTSNYFRTRDALLNAVVERFAARERANWDDLAASISPTTPEDLVAAMVAFARLTVGPQRALTRARYAILGEAAIHPPLREQLATTGGRVNAWFVNWLRTAGSLDPERHAPVIMNHFTGVVLHELAIPDPAFDPTQQFTTLVLGLVRAGTKERS